MSKFVLLLFVLLFSFGDGDSVEEDAKIEDEEEDDEEEDLDAEEDEEDGNVEQDDDDEEDGRVNPKNIVSEDEERESKWHLSMLPSFLIVTAMSVERRASL